MFQYHQPLLQTTTADHQLSNQVEQPLQAVSADSNDGSFCHWFRLCALLSVSILTPARFLLRFLRDGGLLRPDHLTI